MHPIDRYNSKMLSRKGSGDHLARRKKEGKP
jgi:hypothetical protein